MTTASLRVMTMDQSRLMELLAPSTGRAGCTSLAGIIPAMLYTQPHDEEENPVLVRPLPCSYDQLFNKLLSTDFAPSSPSPSTLPPDLCKKVLSFLTVKKVKQEQVSATNCSSRDGIHPLSFSLVDSESSWWLSQPGSMPSGRGEQWVQYTLNRFQGNLQRLSAVSVTIPPMPQGPLSVREFCLQAFSFERGWHAVTPIFTVDNKTGWQRFCFDEIDVEEVRFVCLSNQMAEYLTNLKDNNAADQQLLAQLNRFESVGFFTV
eukprot:CAMPEP_0198145510 /NCGR_PEP_ID=MMETSP1443-20131203/23999_1 /TAXON_ID=186043 /ORGANISM="Entomoneis sp., Strain CCMP2396" /LENGTH=261 /DNA_ID=CAMNT_0043809187 /DNA_START=10 /DNA_END=791 /DNA_ORIENTATION=+